MGLESVRRLQRSLGEFGGTSSAIAIAVFFLGGVAIGRACTGSERRHVPRAHFRRGAGTDGGRGN